MGHPIFAITKTFLQLLSQHIPTPIRDVLLRAYLYCESLVQRFAQIPFIARVRSAIPAKLRRPLSIMALSIFLFLTIGLPMILAKGPAFHCSPYHGEDPLSFTFKQLQPHCCSGSIDDKLKIGLQCEEAPKGSLETRFGQDLGTCGIGRTDACCMRLYYPPEIKRPAMSYCDAAYLVRPEARNVVSARKHES